MSRCVHRMRTRALLLHQPVCNGVIWTGDRGGHTGRLHGRRLACRTLTSDEPSPDALLGAPGSTTAGLPCAEHRIPPLTFLSFTETRRRSAPTSRHSSRFAAVRVLRAIWRGYVSDKVHGDTWAVRTPKPTQRDSLPGEPQRRLEVPSSIVSLIRRARAATLVTFIIVANFGITFFIFAFFIFLSFAYIVFNFTICLFGKIFKKYKSNK